jgi:hypothetical protein
MAAALLATARRPSLRPTLKGPQGTQVQPQPDWRTPVAATPAHPGTPQPLAAFAPTAQTPVIGGSIQQTAAMPVMEHSSGIGPSPARELTPPPQGYSGLMPSPAAVPPTVKKAPSPGQSGLMPSPMMTAPMQGQSGLMPSPLSVLAPQSMGHVAAVSQGSIPPAPRSNTIASAPQPELPSHISGQGDVGPTHVSALRPPGTPSIHGTTPSIEVIDAPRRERSAPYWVVGLVAFVAFGLGLALGILIG